jgi:hypothetical protein
MVLNASFLRAACALIVGSVSAFVCAPALAQTFFSDFAIGFDGWTQQWHIESETGTDGVVTHNAERGFNDSASLKFDMGDGFGDDGTLWIEKQFAVAADLPTLVDLTFQQFSLEQSDFNTFEVKAAISTDNPQVQADFTTIGNTDSIPGWAPFQYGQTITSTTGQVWVALGIRVAFEGHRDYWIDHVTVNTKLIPEPSTAVLAAGLVCLTLLRWRRFGTARADAALSCSAVDSSAAL